VLGTVLQKHGVMDRCIRLGGGGDITHPAVRPLGALPAVRLCELL
jgi:hypothetical protein